MRIEARLTHEPVTPLPISADHTSGAVITFSGVVRDREKNKPISSLDYEAYPSMAIRLMEQILQELSSKYPCNSAEVIHRLGRVPVGETSLWIRVCAPHRTEAFGLLTGFIDRMKLDVPIWKIAS